MTRRTSMNKLLPLLAALLAVAIFAGSCSGSDDPAATGQRGGQTDGGQGTDPDQGGQDPTDPATSEVTVTRGGAGETGEDPDTVVVIELGDAAGDDGPDSIERETTVDGTALDDAAAATLLGRLPDLDEADDDRVEFNRPPDTRPPPVASTRVDQQFPPPGDGATDPVDPTNPGPLQVLRFQPEGPVDLAPFISITFDQPMIELATLDQIEATQVPITVTPDMPGRWRWLGTRTVRFEYEPGAIDRLPAATSYTVEVPAGTASVVGGELAEPLRFEFSTPTPQVRGVEPMHDSLSTEPLWFVEFDQRVDPAAVLEVTELIVAGDRVGVRLATDEEIAGDQAISRLAERALPDRWFALAPVEPLATDAGVELRIGPAIPSAEGPVTSPDVATRSGRTYGPLEITDVECGFDRCQPGQAFRIRFSNPLDLDRFDASRIQVDPPVDGQRIDVSGHEVAIRGFTKGRTEYTVTFAADLTDIYGQSLGNDVGRSIRVGDADPALFQPGRTLVTLDPIVDDDTLMVTSINNAELAVRTYEVDPERDWSAFVENGWRLARDEWTPPWTVTDDRRVETGAERNEFTETPIDLGDDLAGNGHAVVVIGPALVDDDEWRNQPVAIWVQRTHIGLDAYSDHRQAVVRATDMRTGQALAGAQVRMLGGGSGQTDAKGVATVEIGGNNIRGIVAETDDQVALIGEVWLDRWDRGDEARWHVLDDRGLYRPGETVRVKGWLRSSDSEIPAELSLPDDGAKVSWVARDPFGNEIADGSVELSPLGGFDLEFELPADTTLGHAGLELQATGMSGVNHASTFHQFQVQEFRRPDFEVAAEIDTPEPHFAGDSVTVSAQAEYFAGGPLAGSDVEWRVEGRPTSYSPPSWPDFDFGIWVPWWLGISFEFEGGGFGGFGTAPTTEFHSAQTDSAGRHELAVVTETEGKPRPVRVSASATVIDVNRQPISGSAGALVHPAELYVGLRGPRTFVQPGEAIAVEAIVTDLDGELVPGRDIEIVVTRLEWEFRGGTWTEVPVTVDTCTVTSLDGPIGCEFNPPHGGRHRIAATVTDESGRTNLTEITRWVAGGTRPPNRRVELEQLTLVPDGEQWQPGDTAEILVQSPFANAHGLAIITRTGIDRTETFDFDEAGSAVLRIPITDQDVPGIGLQIEVVGTAERTATAPGAERPAFAAGQITLAVPPDSRTLSVQVAPRMARLEPGSDTQVDVAVTGPSGEPVEGAEMVVVVVDEAVLSLTGYELGDPLASFYPNSGGGVQGWRGRATLVLSDPSVGDGEFGDEVDAEMAEESAGVAMADMAADDAAAPTATRSMAIAPEAQGGGDSAQAPIELRTDFDALAVFEPQVVTDADGRATIDVPLPDNLTRYRVMVVATADATDAGSGESNITARLPVSVRPTPPRFANFGDRFEFPVVVQNATDDDLEVDVALRATNLSVTGRQATTVSVPANDRVEVRFAVEADDAGTARYQVVATSGEFADAAEGSLPVYTPATAEAFATYGVVDQGSIAQPLVEPVEVFSQFGGLEISTSSTAVSTLTDAVIYLKDYRYENSDAFASRIIAIVALDDILVAFEAAELPSPTELAAVMNSDIERLVRMQNNDGGFPYWQRGRESIPYQSVQATHALVLASDEGLDVPTEALDRALGYLGEIRNHLPDWYSERARRAIEAYALHVRFLAGDLDIDAATSVYERAAGEQVDVAAWVWPILADTPLDAEIEDLLNNRVTETANSATFTTDYEEQAWVLLHSDRRSDAIVLDALLRMRPDSDLVLKTLNGILAARGRRGHWTNVQENSFVLLAGSAYFDAFEDVDPDFVARAWLGDTYALAHDYQGRSTDQNVTVVPMAELVGGGDRDIVVAKDGDDGRLYYRIGLRYAPTDFELAPRDQGFVVDRTYEAVDDPADVTRNDDGSFTVRAGARVRVQLTMVADSRRTHVALIDPLPAGLEPLNPALATTEPIPRADPADAQHTYWWYRWFDHQNLRDDRAEAFATWLGAGSYEYTYVARATTPGTFVVPPTRAEMMYEPEVFGRSANTTLTIVDL